MRHGMYRRQKFESLADYRREEKEKASRKAFRDRIIKSDSEETREDRLPTSKFNGKSYSLGFFTTLRKDARKKAYELNNKGYATKISKHLNDNKKDKYYFIVWKR
jgi:hypothetical protein